MAVSHPIAFCTLHGLFPATAIAIAPGASVGVLGCIITCPQCGTPSEIIPGTYLAHTNQAGVDRINLLIDPSISLPALGAIRKLAERAQAGEISAEQAKREAEKIHPKAGKLFDIANWSDQAKATLYASVIGAVAIIAAARIASPPSQTTVIHPVVAERVVAKPDALPLRPNAPKHGKAPQPKRHPKKRP